MRGLLTVSLAAILAGCAGPRLEAPTAAAVVAPQDWRISHSTGDVSPRWWMAFNDPVLARLVDTALANNPDIAIAATRVAEARAQLVGVRGQALPQVSAAGGGGEQREVNPFGQGLTQAAGQVELSITYDLDLFGRLSSATKAARASLLASEAAHANVRLAIAATTVQAYLGLRALDERLTVLRRTLEARAASLHLADRRFTAGYSSALDLRQAQAEYRATEQLIPAVQLLIARQEGGLNLLLGSNPAEVARGLALAAIAAPTVPVGLPSTLLRQRPDIVQAEHQLVSADRSLDSARAAFMPNIRLSADGGAVAAEVLGDPITIFSVGGSILAPIFQGGRLRAQADAATARRDAAAFIYRKAAITAFREVEDALAAIQRLDEQERALEGQRDVTANALALATSRYKAGYSPFLEQLDAQRSLLGVDLALVQVRSDRLSAAVDLFRALGGGWDRGPE